MATWILWVYLVTGERIEAGQYQTEGWCYAGAQRQKVFLMKQRPRPVRMSCELMVLS